MNAFKTIVKILTALAAVAGAIYIIATYGDKIVAWAKNLLENCPCKCKCNVEKCECSCEGECECGGECKCECTCDCQCEDAAEEAPAEEVIEEVIVEENAPVADESDFAE